METALKVGTQVQGGEYTYTVEQIIGQGGFGITYKVSARIKIGKIEQVTYFAMKELFLGDLCERDHTTNRVKFSAPTREKVENSKKDFLSEARRLNSIDHPNVVAVNEVFEANDTAYYVMEYLTGDSLRRYIDKNGVLNEEQTKTLIAPLLNAVGYLHDNRLTHLDIKPDNIMLKPGRDGELIPVLIDFGLSKHYDTSGNATSTVRMSGLSHGYAPLEQYEGITTFTPQADVYALAATMLFCMTGSDPVKASEASADWIRSVLPTEVSIATADALCHAMKAIKTERSQSVSSFAHELGISLDAATATSVSSESLTQSIVNPKPKKKDGSTEIIDCNKPKLSPKRWVTPVLIGLVILVIGVLGYYAVNHIFGGTTTDSSSVAQAEIELEDSTSMPDEMAPVSVPVVSDIEVVDEEVDLLERQYQSDYSTAERLYTQGKYTECKQRCQAMLNSYPTHRTEINALISECDSAISAAEQAAASSRLPDKAVDLGLSVLWSDRNVGASSPSDYGGYYAWGETSTKSDYSWSTYTHCDGSYNTCHNIGSNIAGTRYDVARQKWGGGWKMPTKSQWEELINRCTWTWTTQGGHRGYKVTGPNGNSIFLPAAGNRYGTSSDYVGSVGLYWSATLLERNTYYAWHLYFDSGGHYMHYNYRGYGRTVRPVTEK